MSLATLNKQRSVEKQSIKTTVTISKVSKSQVSTTNTSPITSMARNVASPDGMSEKSDVSTESPQTVREKSNSPDEIPFVDDSANVVLKHKELAKERFFKGSENDFDRRGMFHEVLLFKFHA
jgi:hypothetical protein